MKYLVGGLIIAGIIWLVCVWLFNNVKRWRFMKRKKK